MLLGHSSVLLVMSERALDFYLLSNKTAGRFDFPVGTIAHLDVIDSEVFTKSLTEFIHSLPVSKQNYSLVLAPQLVFTHKVSEEEMSDSVETVKKHFATVLPFSPSNIAFATLEEKDAKLIFATPKSLYMLVVETLENLQWKNDKVLAFQFLEGIPYPISGDDAKEALHQTARSKKGFSTQNAVINDRSVEVVVNTPVTEKNDASEETEDDEANEETPKKTSKLLLIILGIVVLAMVAVLGYTFFGKSLLPKKEVTHTPTVQTIAPSPTPIASPITQPESSITKDQLTFSILNGSGRVGDAGRVKTFLISKGYTGPITTENAPSTATQSSITFSPQVSASLQTELETLLKSELPNAVTKQATISSNVLIITGK